jgi:hypothetical protein
VALQQAEARPAGVIEGDDLAIEDQLMRSQRSWQASQLRNLAVASSPLVVSTRSGWAGSPTAATKATF